MNNYMDNWTQISESSWQPCFAADSKFYVQPQLLNHQDPLDRDIQLIDMLF